MEDATTLEIRVRPCTTEPRSRRRWIRCRVRLVRSLLLRSLLCLLFRLVVLFIVPLLRSRRSSAQGQGSWCTRRCLRLVVAFAQSHFGKTESFVQCQGRSIVDSHFKQHAFGPLLTCPRNQRLHQRSRDSLPLEPSADADRHDFRIVAVIPETGIAAHNGLLSSRIACNRSSNRLIHGNATRNPAIRGLAVIINIEQIRACWRLEFLANRLFAPRSPAEQVRFQSGHLRHCDLFIDACMVNDHAVSSLRAFRAGMVEYMLQRVRHRHVRPAQIQRFDRLRIHQRLLRSGEGCESFQSGRASSSSA